MLRQITLPLFIGMAALLVFSARLKAEEILSVADSLGVGADQAAVTVEGFAGGVQDLDRDVCCDRFAACPDSLRWTVDANALFLTRRVAPVSLITDFDSGADVLSTSALDLCSHTGLELGLTRHWGNGNALEARYAGVDGWNAQAFVPTTLGDSLQINAGVPLFNAAGTAIDASYASQWHSFELNGRREICQQRAVLLAGVRYAELDEAWGFALSEGSSPLQLETSTRNRLWGFQLGGDAVLWDRGGRLSLEGDAKAGIYGNRAAQASLIRSANFPSSDHGTSAAFLGELGLTGNLQITQGLSIRGGYRLVWINGVALAPEQLAARDAFGQGLDISGDAFLHGAFVGLQYVR